MHDLFGEPSAENLESESECNIVNVTTELNYDDHIKPSANVIEASYFNIFECGRFVKKIVHNGIF